MNRMAVSTCKREKQWEGGEKRGEEREKGERVYEELRKYGKFSGFP